jgi:hypothetical protein
MDVDALREAAIRLCPAPKRYLADDDVINNPEETKIVQLEWDVYFAKMRAIMEQYPFSEKLKGSEPTVQSTTTS